MYDGEFIASYNYRHGAFVVTIKQARKTTIKTPRGDLVGEAMSKEADLFCSSEYQARIVVDAINKAGREVAKVTVPISVGSLANPKFAKDKETQPSST